MEYNFSRVDAILSAAAGKDTPAAQLVIRKDNRVVYARAFGWLDVETRQVPANLDTLFDMASVTKLFTTTCLMRLVEAGKVSLDRRVVEYLPEFHGLRPVRPYENPLQANHWVDVSQGGVQEVAAETITLRQLLTHSSGLPAWRPFKDEPDAEAARHLALNTFFSYQPGTRVVYSDVGLILIGMIVEQISGYRLDDAISRFVTHPLGLTKTRYLPVGETIHGLDSANIAPTEFCQWRHRRIQGEVHDESAARLGGIAGHAGIFSTAEDTASLGQMYLNGGVPLLKAETVAEMVKLQSEFEGTRRGIGFALWSADPEASSNPFSPQTYGHTGFTGTSLWMDPQRALVAALLTNEVYNGREHRPIMPLRVQVHRAIVSAVDAA